MLSRILFISFLIFISAFFSACEMAVSIVNRIRLKHRAEAGSNGAKRTLEILKKYEKALSTILVGNNIVNLTISAVATVLMIDTLPPEIMAKYGELISIISTTALVLIFSEILPKSLVRVNAEGFCIAVSGILSVLMFLFTPFTWILLRLQKLTLMIFNTKKKIVSVTEEELIHIIDEIEGEGVLEEQESTLVRSALMFDETMVDEILTPRVNTVAVSLNSDTTSIRDIFLTEGYSRLPVYEKTIDHITGIITLKDFMQALLENKEFNISEIVQETLYVPALMKISEVLKLMQRKKVHLSVVVDQYGGTEGIVTLEDILEELVGEIYDEDDVEYPPINFISDTSFLVSGTLPRNDFNRYFERHGMDYEINSDANTVGGWVFELFGKIPEEKDIVKTDEFDITVLSIKERRIENLRFEIKKPKNDSDST